ncbi:uncharacterized protein LOC121804081 [Salvia splendens]|uniref:uncharacterized protein LOC121804081 n=1 Tax=Salvia splendens TaxID=180675 RepID=UPI001C258DE2|nr:uncharacterized protein LOC121804081 [Salvia splendens]
MRDQQAYSRLQADVIEKKFELEKAMEDLKQANEEAVQSWLDSRPLIDELEKIQAELNATRARVANANSVISDLQAQLGTTEMCIKSAKDEEHNMQMRMNVLNQDVHTMQEETEQLKAKIVRKRRKISKLKLGLRLKRQTLETFELTCEAVELESRAFHASLAQALYYIDNSEAANVMIHLSQEEYGRLKQEANERISDSERRVSKSADEKLRAEKARDLAFRRLLTLHPHNRFRQNNIREQITNMKRPRYPSKRRHGFNSPTGANQHQKSKNYYTFHVKKKESIFFRIKIFIVPCLTKYFKRPAV